MKKSEKSRIIHNILDAVMAFNETNKKHKAAVNVSGINPPMVSFYRLGEEGKEIEDLECLENFSLYGDMFERYQMLLEKLMCYEDR